MLLLITGSTDGTADRIVESVGTSNVFRFNYDIWKDYKFTYSPDSWEIVNPTGHSISHKNATKCFWWKAFHYYINDDRLIKSEIKYALKDLYGWFLFRGMTKGNSIFFHEHMGKINILGLAKKYFVIPSTNFSLNLYKNYFNDKQLIAKSLSSQRTSDEKVLMTTKIPSLGALDKNYPWYIQEEIISDYDITVFQCGKDLFAFKRSRKGLKSIDWRQDQEFDYSKQEWFPFDLNSSDQKSLIKLSDDMNVEFGRYDFMLNKDKKLVFLEFNATGQWVFLDIFNKYGLVKHVTDWLKK